MSERGYVYNKQNNYGINKEDGPGMNYIREIRRVEMLDREQRKPKSILVGTFGIVDSKGNPIIMNWIHDGWRKDKPSDIEAPEPMGRYGKDLFDSMFKGWN